MTDLRDFLNWFDGFAENIEKTPSPKQWGKIKERVTALREAAPVAAAQPAKPAPFVRPKKVEPEYHLIIDKEGIARRGRGDKAPVTRAEVAGQEIVDLRGMEADPRGIVWADGSSGLNGADCTLTYVTP